MQWTARLLLSFCLPFVGFWWLRYTLIQMRVHRLFSNQMNMYVAGFATFGLVTIAWMLIWRGMVRWTPARKLATSIVALSAEPVGFLLGLILSGGDEDFGWFLCAVLPSPMFVLGTIAVWVQYPKWPRRAEKRSEE